MFHHSQIIKRTLHTSLISKGAAQPVQVSRGVPSRAMAFVQATCRLTIRHRQVTSTHTRHRRHRTVRAGTQSGRTNIGRRQVSVIMGSNERSNHLAGRSKGFRKLQPIRRQYRHRRNAISGVPTGQSSRDTQFQPTHRLHLIKAINHRLFSRHSRNLQKDIFSFRVVTSNSSLPSYISHGYQGVHHISFRTGRESHVHGRLRSNLQTTTAFHVFFLRRAFQRFTNLTKQRQHLLGRTHVGRVTNGSKGDALQGSWGLHRHGT